VAKRKLTPAEREERDRERALSRAHSQWLRELAEEALEKLPPERRERVYELRRLHGAPERPF
jgi:hypothetical protein